MIRGMVKDRFLSLRVAGMEQIMVVVGKHVFFFFKHF